jgi:hypothetical protein
MTVDDLMEDALATGHWTAAFPYIGRQMAGWSESVVSFHKGAGTDTEFGCSDRRPLARPAIAFELSIV